MDTKYILSSILREAKKFGGAGPVQAAVRLSGAVNGDRGEGYWLLYENMLTLLYRKLGERDYEGCGAAPEYWNFGDYREEKYALAIAMSCDEQTFECVFTPSERESAEAVLNAIQTAQATPQTVYSESALLMAGLLWQLSGDGHEDFARRLLGVRLLRAGRKYAESTTLPKMVEQADACFDVRQKKSLLANLIEQRMSDGEWSGEEQHALAELAGVWKLEAGVFDVFQDVLLLKNQCPLLFQ